MSRLEKLDSDMIKSLLRPIQYLASEEFRLRYKKWRTRCVADSQLDQPHFQEL